MAMKIRLAVKGGAGSGNWGHAGRPGKRGGSMLRSVSMSIATGLDWRERQQEAKRRGAGRPGTAYTGKIVTTDAEKVLTSSLDIKGIENRLSTRQQIIRDRIAELPNDMSISAATARDKISELQGEYKRNQDIMTKVHGVMFSKEDPEDPDWEYASYNIRAAIKHDIAETLADESGVSYDNTNRALKQWAMTSNDNDMRSLSLQEAVTEEFGVKLSDWQKSQLKETSAQPGSPILRNPIMPRHDERGMLRAMHGNTQQALSKAGYKPGDTITLYRGIESAAKLPKTGSSVDYSGNAMESWSVSADIANYFVTDSSNTGRGFVLAMQVPIENILGTARTGFGCMNEGEFVIFGSIPGSQAQVTSAHTT